MYLIWDILTVAVILTFAASAYRKGFLHTITRLIGSVGAVLFAVAYSEPIANMVFERYLRGSLLETVAGQLGALSEQGADAFLEGLEEMLSGLPGWLYASVQPMLAPSAESWYAQLEQSDPAAVSVAITDSVLAPAAVGLLRVLAFFLLFSVLMLLVNTIAGLLKSVNALPLIGPLNEILGGLFGALQGMLYVFVFASLLWFVVAAVGDAGGILSAEQIERTWLFRWFYLAGPWARTAG